MFEEIQLLPEICAIKVWSHQQKSLLSFKSMEWEWVGKRLSFLFAEHLGTRPPDPLTYFYSQFFDGATQGIIEGEKEEIRLKSDYLFALFLVINEHWQVIQSRAKTLSKDFKFPDPKTLFLEVCREMSSAELADAINNDPATVSGINLSEVRKEIKSLGKFYRGKHPEQEKLTTEFLDSTLWGEFVLAAVYQTKKNYLHNSHSWKRLLKAQKEQERLVATNRVCLLWNQGIPVNSQNKKRS